jgi:hypothetical protein
MTRFGWYIEGGSLCGEYDTYDDAVAAALEEGHAGDRRLRVGPMRDFDVANLLDVDDVIELLDLEDALNTRRVCELAAERAGDIIEEGTCRAFPSAGAALRDWASEYLIVTAKPGAEDALAQWAKQSLCPDPSRYCAGEALPREERPTFDELVARVPPLPTTGLASAESPPDDEEG